MSARKVYGPEEEDLERELERRGYIPPGTSASGGMNQNEFACFDIETLERATVGDGGTEAHLTLCSIACCDTMSSLPVINDVGDGGGSGGGGEGDGGDGERTWFRVIGNSTNDNEKQRLGIFFCLLYMHLYLVDAFIEHLMARRDVYIERHWAGAEFDRGERELLEETKSTFNTKKKIVS